MPFKPGKSGNPGGRPKGTSLMAVINNMLEKKLSKRDMGLGLSSKIYKDAFVEVLASEAIRGNMKALEMIMDRTMGKAQAFIEHSGAIDGDKQVIVLPSNGRELS